MELIAQSTHLKEMIFFNNNYFLYVTLFLTKNCDGYDVMNSSKLIVNFYIIWVQSRPEKFNFGNITAYYSIQLFPISFLFLGI